MQLIKNAENEPETKNPWADDKLNRQPTAKSLTGILTTIIQPFVISLDSPFGTGKSFFIKRWVQELKNDNASVVYFNAWETDYAQDPLMAFWAVLEDDFFTDSTNTEGADNVKKIAKKLLTSMALNAVEVATSGVVKKADWKTTAEALQSERYEAHKATRDTIKEFRNALQDYGQKRREQDAKKRPIIIFIDELDRCRPDYAIRLLEIIKHLFHIENYIFVLSIDRKQIISSIGAVYGPTVDGAAYLKKFVEWNYVLPEPDAKSFVTFLYDKFSLRDVMDVNILSSLFRLSLRDIERHMTHINILARSGARSKRMWNATLSPLLLILKDRNEQLYREYCTQAGHDQQVMDYLKEQMRSEAFLADSELRWANLCAQLISAAYPSGDKRKRILLEKLKDKTRNRHFCVEDYYKEEFFPKAGSMPWRDGDDSSRHLAYHLYEHIENITRGN